MIKKRCYLLDKNADLLGKIKVPIVWTFSSLKFSTGKRLFTIFMNNF